MGNNNNDNAGGDEPLAGSSLLQRIAAGDRAAADECIACYGGLVWSLALRLAPSPQDAEDAVQEIFLDLWRFAGRFDPRQGAEKVFIATIARRRLIDRLRAHGRQPPLEPLDDEQLPGVDAGLDAAVTSSRALRALGELPEPQRGAVAMSVIYGYSHDEIAQRTGLPLGTVKTYVRRGLIKIRAALTAPKLSA